MAKAKSLLNLDGKELLRVYWYDGVMANGLTAQQRAMVEVDDLQFRAGTINSAKQQKGVDSLIVTDLIELTTRHAICDAVLVTGDSDLAVGIELAQKRGVRIAVLGVEDLAVGVAHHQSWEITSRADRVGRLGSADLADVVRYKPRAAPPHPDSQGRPPQTAPERILSPADQLEITQAVEKFVGGQSSLANALDAATHRIEASVDRSLIHHVFTELSRRQMTNGEKVFARFVFRSLLKP